ncbi:MAG: GNAT family N-acetyltransferase, partial [Desulfovibrionaceae bacterium]
AAIEGAGALHITTARGVQGELAGYAIYFVQAYPHVQHIRMAQSDALYLAPAYRKGFAGLRLLQAAERALVDKGVQNIMQTCTVKKDFGVLLRRMGYVNTETVYRKEI